MTTVRKRKKKSFSIAGGLTVRGVPPIIIVYSVGDFVGPNLVWGKILVRGGVKNER